MGHRVPQHVQNLVIREYCKKRELHYLLSAAEYRMPSCDLILWQVIGELTHLHGIAAYSIYQLPESSSKRLQVIKTVLEARKTFYFAVEGLKLSNAIEHERIEALWQVSRIIPQCPTTLN